MKLILIVHNIRSALNVGSLLRSADGLGVEKVFLSGYTPYPAGGTGDDRLPYLAAKIDKRIAKTALNAQKSVKWDHIAEISAVVATLRKNGYEIAALEQSLNSLKLDEYKAPSKVALIVGSEIGGLDKAVLDMTDVVLEIPMQGAKESLNVAVAGAVAIYTLKNQA